MLLLPRFASPVSRSHASYRHDGGRGNVVRSFLPGAGSLVALVVRGTDDEYQGCCRSSSSPAGSGVVEAGDLPSQLSPVAAPVPCGPQTLVLALQRTPLPRTMTEKIHWLKLYDSTPLKGRLADKFLVREWVADTVGEEYLVPLLGVWDSPDEIDFAPCRAASRSKPRTARGGTSSCRTRALLMRSGPVDASGSGSACVRR